MNSSIKKDSYSKKPKSISNKNLSLTSVLETGGHLGRPQVHRSQRTLCIGQKNGFWVYDGEIIKQSLQVSYLYLKYFMGKQGPILVINQEDSLKEGVKVFCEKLGFYHMQEKWMGGLLTNWGQAKKQRTHFLKVQETHGELLEKNKDRSYLKVKNRFKGLEGMPGRPSLCIILDIQDSEYAFKEALKLKIPVMAFMNTDDDLNGVSLPIFGANKSLKWVRWVFNLFLYWYDKDEKKGWVKENKSRK